MSRLEEVAQERRRRQPGTLDRMSQLKLEVPQSVIDANPGKSFRFINDDGNRMHEMTVQDDWTKVDEKLSPPIPVGTDKFGKPIMAHLCAKPTQYVEADRQEALDRISNEEKAIMKGQHSSPDALKEAFVPDGAANSISTGYTP
jgi:hypothetical protein